VFVEIVMTAPHTAEVAREAFLENLLNMRQSVGNGFVQITKDHEGLVPWLYLDVKGLVTTGVGNLVERTSPSVINSDGSATFATRGVPTDNLFDQPWLNASGNLASHAEIQAAFDAVKARQDLAHLGGGNQAFANLTSIRLGPPGVQVNQVTPQIQAFVEHTLTDFEHTLKRGLPNFDELNADAQFALFEHAWAVGPALDGWPHLRAALTESPPNYRTALIEDHQVGVTAERAKMTRDLWQNAIDVQDQGADPDRLYYPGTVSSPAFPFPSGGIAQGSGTSNLSASLSSRVSPLNARTAQIALGASLIAGGGGYLAYRYGVFDNLLRMMKRRFA
jgi:hypothetical protein